MNLNLTEPSASSRLYLRKVASTTAELRRELKANGIRVPKRRHSKLFEAGARAKITTGEVRG